MFSPKQLLVNCITLLCLEHREGVATSPSNELIGTILESLPVPEGTVDTDHGKQTYFELRKLLTWLNSRPATDFPTESELLQQVQVACREEGFLYEAIANALFEPISDTKLLIKKIHSYRKNMQSYINDELITKILKDYNHQLTFKRGTVANVTDLITEMGSKLEPLVSAKTRSAHPAQMGHMDFSETEGVSKYFDDVKSLMSTDGAFRTGWQAINRMLGKVGAIKRGEFGIVGGLQHNFKSGFMLSLFVHFCLFNKPFLRDKTRKPLILFVTFENEIPDNLLWIYKYLKENETGMEVPELDVTPAEAAEYVGMRLRETGFEVMMERFDPTEFSAASFTNYLDGLMADGYELQMLVIDYLNMLPKTGLEAKVAGDDIRLLFRRIRNYTAPRGIACLTPHQLSSEALQLTRDNVEDLVRTVANKGFYDGCRRLGQEPDLEMFIHIVRVNGQAYLTIARGKHRNTVTPEKDQYACLPFQKIGTIPWDIDKEVEITVATPGGGALGSDAEEPWWGMAA